MAGSVVSVNVAEPREIEWLGRRATTSIWKEPVAGPLRVAGINLLGDDQADRRFHGGRDKAVYAYAREDYEWWSRELGREVGNGAFGENLAVAGLDVTGAVVGERWAVGSVLLEVAAPRVVELGGSRAQRDVFHDTLLEACFRAGDMDRAERLLAERVARRPDHVWKTRSVKRLAAAAR